MLELRKQVVSPEGHRDGVAKQSPGLRGEDRLNQAPLCVGEVHRMRNEGGTNITPVRFIGFLSKKSRNNGGTNTNGGGMNGRGKRMVI